MEESISTTWWYICFLLLKINFSTPWSPNGETSLITEDSESNPSKTWHPQTGHIHRRQNIPSQHLLQTHKPTNIYRIEMDVHSPMKCFSFKNVSLLTPNLQGKGFCFKKTFQTQDFTYSKKWRERNFWSCHYGMCRWVQEVRVWSSDLGLT